MPAINGITNIAIYNELGLYFNTPDGHPRRTQIEWRDRNRAGFPVGFANWEQFKLYLEERGYDFTNNYWLDADDALQSPFCCGGPNVRPTFQNVDNPMAKKTLLPILRSLLEKPDKIKPSSYTWGWLTSIYYNIENNWYNETRQRSYYRQYDVDRTDACMVMFLAECNRYLKHRNPEFKDVIVSRSLGGRYSFGFKRYFKSYYHLYYTEDDPCTFIQQENLVPETSLNRMIQEQTVKEVDGEYYTTDHWIKFSTWADGSKKQTTVFWPTHKHELCRCEKCRSIVFKKEIKEILELDSVVCPSCSGGGIPKNAEHTRDTVFSGYHSHGNWKFLIRRNHGEWDSLPMGIEIEMHPNKNLPVHLKEHPNRIAWNLYNEQQDINPKWHEFYCERDGSLGDRGIELVSNPMTLGFAQEYWGKMLPILRKYCVGWNTIKHNGGANSYGIHITSNRKYWKDLQLARLIKFMDYKANAEFLYCIAQRSFNFGSGSSKIGGGNFKTLSKAVGFSNKKITNSPNKYGSINVKSNNLIEIRVFASTLMQSSFLKNFEFVDSFWNWTRVTPLSFHYEDYLKWMSSQPIAYKRWPNLLSYLLKDHFYYKVSADHAIKSKNKFKEFIKTTPVGQMALDLPVTAEITDVDGDIECV